jgi:DNA-binding NarL/FixJ family response regulator
MVIDQVRSSFEEPNSFVGRERELDQLRQFARSVRAVTLCGSGVLAGFGRIAMDQGEITLARRHLTESIELSQSMGNRIGVIRGLEAFASLAAAEQRPDRAVQLAAAAAALRQAAHLPSRPAARTERLLAADSLGPEAIARLRAEGSSLEASSAVELALTLSLPPGGGAGGDTSRSGASATPPGGLTPREREIVGLIVRGCSNRAIAEELVISPATAARHVANILLKLGFSSRAQVAAWAASGDSTERAEGARRRLD